jgi:enoyl-CoA hydratase/carnithine racemase
MTNTLNIRRPSPHVAEVWLNRPEVRIAFNDGVVAGLTTKVAEIVDMLVANGPAAVRACKRLVHDVAGRPVDAALRDETALRIADIRASEEGREGVQAFLGKREPAWRKA